MMPRVTVILFDCEGYRLSNDMPFGKKNFGKSVPMVGVKRAVFNVFDFVGLSSERCAIAENPCKSFLAATVNGLDEPMFCFLSR
jgi:hypothetical protein